MDIMESYDPPLICKYIDLRSMGKRSLYIQNNTMFRANRHPILHQEAKIKIFHCKAVCLVPLMPHILGIPKVKPMRLRSPKLSSSNL